MDLQKILSDHQLWLLGKGGTRANLSRANLSWADLSRANLSRADLSRADLSWANLSRADLSWANLSGANLSWADLSGANLSGANLSWADLSLANLSRADLSWADLSWANLSRANLSWANLSGANLERCMGANLAIAMGSFLPQEGAFVGWKKCRDGIIVKLQIGAKAKRSHGAGRKCRCEYAKVLQVIGGEVGVSMHNPHGTEPIEYRKGQTVRCHKWDEDRWKGQHP